MRGRLVIVSLSLVALLAACGGETPAPQAPTPPPPPSASAPPAISAPEVKKEEPAPAPTPEVKKEEPPARKPPTDVIVGSTFMFSLSDSPDAKVALIQGCEKKSKDAKKVDACVKAGEESAAKEGVRYEKDDKGNLWYVSFGDEKGKEVVYNKIQFKIVDDKAIGKLTVAPEGKDTGKRPMKDMPKEIVIELPDDTTVVMADPKKGKLVFKKK